ncbi:MAG: hypothetical protein KHX31_06675 [Akkermansia sp.]|uniref:hypothetical protein n=1 Tax=Akkermansia sp. TaxID=1872421 RepID=UPI0025C280D7|nr:hypothetical protein [Akkermansia sp.]MBS5508302.1 hypothetical protein [Akkermansia sp.]
MANGITYQLNMDNSGFNRGLGEARSAVSGFSSLVSPQMMVIAGATAAAAAAVKGFSMAWQETRQAMNEAANRETMETAFIPILGSAKAARERMEELADFAAHTPFQLPGIASASKILETLTDGALSTGDGLRLVGDTASGCNSAIEDMAVTIGRLYSGLDSGRPVGEAMQRMQELGAISPDVRAKLESLQAAGKKGAEVWKVAADELAKFSGGMELQAATWNGKISTLADAWALVRAEFGRPINDALKPLLDASTAQIERLAATARTIGEAIGYGLRYTMEAFQQGEFSGLVANSLKLGFAEGINSFWAGTQGWLSMLGAGLVEAVKTGMMVFDIMSNVSFWSGVGVALLSVLQAAVAGAMGGLSQSMASFLTMIPGAEKYKEFASGLAVEFYKAASQYMTVSETSAQGVLDEYGGAATKRFIETMSNLSTAFERGYNNTPDVWDTTSYREDIKTASDRIVAALAAQDKERAAQAQKEGTKAKREKEDTTPPMRVNWETVFAGSLAKVGGGGYGRMMLSAENVPQKQLAAQKKANDLLEKIHNKLGRNSIAVLG